LEGRARLKIKSSEKNNDWPKLALVWPKMNYFSKI